MLRLAIPHLPRLRLHLKLEGFNPTRSVKDRPGLHIIQQAILRGDLVKGMTILDASSGNMACSLAFFGRLLCFESRFAVSSKLTDDKRSFLRFFRAELFQTGDFTIEGSRWCRRFLEDAEPGKWFFADQLHNWDNPQAHYETTGPEILAALVLQSARKSPLDRTTLGGHLSNTNRLAVTSHSDGGLR